MPLKAVVFDWGGTLSVWAEVDLADMWIAAAGHLDPEHPEDLVPRLLEIEDRFWKRVSSTQQSATLSEILAAASEELELDVAEAVLEEAATHHLDAWTPHIRHDPDGPEVLAGIKQRGLKIGLLSNTLWPREFHDRFLERDGLIDYFDARLYTSHMARTKPHPSVFHAALDALGVEDPGDAVFVGDRPFDDIFGARRVGMKAVLRPNDSLPSGFTLVEADPVEPDAVIAELPRLLPLLDAWSGE